MPYDHITGGGSTIVIPPPPPPQSNVTKVEIESVLTGEISSHYHPGGGGGLTQPQIMGRSLGC
jgi:hypothetical protein